MTGARAGGEEGGEEGGAAGCARRARVSEGGREAGGRQRVPARPRRHRAAEARFPSHPLTLSPPGSFQRGPPSVAAASFIVSPAPRADKSRSAPTPHLQGPQPPPVGGVPLMPPGRGGQTDRQTDGPTAAVRRQNLFLAAPAAPMWVKIAWVLGWEGERKWFGRPRWWVFGFWGRVRVVVVKSGASDV